MPETAPNQSADNTLQTILIMTNVANVPPKHARANRAVKAMRCQSVSASRSTSSNEIDRSTASSDSGIESLKGSFAKSQTICAAIELIKSLKIQKIWKKSPEK
jgi:hypothetical protein